MLIVRHLGTPNSDFSGCHCMRDPVLYRSMVILISKSRGYKERQVDEKYCKVFVTAQVELNTAAMFLACALNRGSNPSEIFHSILAWT